MVSTTAKPAFKGPYREVLSDLFDLLETLFEEHGTSWVRAGDNQVYCLGGNGYTVVFDEKKWDGLLEVNTPDVSISIRLDANRDIAVAAANRDEKTIKSGLRQAIDAIKKYYSPKNRYWFDS